MSEDFEINGLTWVDKTTYHKGENPENKKSNLFATRINDQGSVIIVYGHRDYPNKWVFSFSPLDIYHKSLKAQTKEEAAKEAIEICLKTIEELKKGFEASEKTETAN